MMSADHFDFIQDNDIALLVLSSPVTNVTPVTFPVDSQMISSTVKPTTTKPTTTTSKTTTPKTTTTKTSKPTTTNSKPTTTTKKTTSTCKPCKPGCYPTEPLEPFMRGYSTYANSPAVITGWGISSSGCLLFFFF